MIKLDSSWPSTCVWEPRLLIKIYDQCSLTSSSLTPRHCRAIVAEKFYNFCQNNNFCAVSQTYPSNKTFTPKCMQYACYSSHSQTCPWAPQNRVAEKTKRGIIVQFLAVFGLYLVFYYGLKWDNFIIRKWFECLNGFQDMPKVVMFEKRFLKNKL